jgi:hypothetical protein
VEEEEVWFRCDEECSHFVVDEKKLVLGYWEYGLKGTDGSLYEDGKFYMEEDLVGHKK